MEKFSKQELKDEIKIELITEKDKENLRNR